ncbi:WRKY domain-containing protein [Cephalotus follicularis]|uniref:WRKY domain-containing protein n=1 Tax=Cephalotus follicularis TaxID=3775 RepID=A0A1Q3CT48_CEPFO|nr:WRKY domain-containing protein [Cephalotus follicularis]
MAESESHEVENHKRHEDGQQNDDEELSLDEEEEEQESQLSELREELLLAESRPDELRDYKLETLKFDSVARQFLEKDQCQGFQVNYNTEALEGVILKEQDRVSHHEVLASVTVQSSEAQTQTQLPSSVCPPSLSELSPTSVTQSISSAPSPTLEEQKHSPPKVNSGCMPEKYQRNSSDFKSLSIESIVKSPVPDAYNWRKYGQKQVKSPIGSRSYYKCTHSDCCAKKIECSDHTGLVIEIVTKGLHSHDPPRKNNSTRDGRFTSSVRSDLGSSVTEHPVKMLKDSGPSTSSKEPALETPIISERKRQNSAGFDGNGEIQVKEEHISEPESKRRVKKGDLASLKCLSKPGKKPKFVVHAAGDVGISGDGYRWRKYGQKMVKGNPHPRNYYRCTSAGCPVRKHIETAIDNTTAVIITYKGVHDHDMPVPKKRHGPPSAPLVAAAAPASMNSSQKQKTPTQWSVGTEGELTGETVDLGGEKAMESARTLLSIGFEIKPC